MKRELSYQFDLDIQRVHLIINMKCDVQLWWKSGKRKIATKNSLKLTGTEKYFDVRQKLSIIAKISIQNGVLQQKKTQLLIILFTSESTSKLGGRVYLNLAQYISPDNLTATVVRKYQRSLENCPDEASKIVFNLSCKYIQQSVNGMGSENANDISFQANNFSSSFGAGSSFGRSTADMTFRPEKQRQDHNQRWQNSSQGLQQGTQNMRQLQHSPKEKNKLQQREWEREKLIQTPSWDRTYRQKPAYEQNLSQQSGRERQREQQKSNQRQRPLQFSFNPMNAVDRQKIGLDNTQIIKDLKQIVEERGQQIKSLRDQIVKMKAEYQQRSQKSSSKSISLLNQLNSASVQKQQLQREKSQLMSQLESMKEDNKKLQQKCKQMHFQFSQSNNEFVNKLQQRKKMIEELNMKLEECDKRANRYKDQLFKRENEIITKQKQFIASQISKETVNKQQTQKLKSISSALKELQSNFQKVFAEKQDLQRRLDESNYKLQRVDELNNKICLNMPKLEQELQRQKQKSKMIEAKFKQKQNIIQEIENEFKIFSSEKVQLLKQKEQQLVQLRDKFNAACKKIDDIGLGQQSMKNTISEKNIRIKSLEGICAQLQKNIQEKQVLIRKAKEYVTTKEEQIEQKNEEITKRDEFIQKCRTYMEGKEKQYNQFMSGIKNNSNVQNATIKKELKQKELMLQQYITQRHKMQKQINDMDQVINRLKDKINQYEDQIDELQRKHQSQEGTLKDLVKKNLDMEIQLNIKDYEIQALKANR